MSVARRLDPYFTLYYDLTGDGIADIIACAENQSNGQINCQTINTATESVIGNMNILTPAYLVGNYLTIYDFNADDSLDGLACGIKLSDGSVECQIKDLKTGATVGVGQFVAIPPGSECVRHSVPHFSIQEFTQKVRVVLGIFFISTSDKYYENQFQREIIAVSSTHDKSSERP